MNTITGIPIGEDIRAILYLCDFSDRKELKVISTLQFQDSFRAINTYAEIPNPESQLIIGATYEELCKNLELQHSLMANKHWLELLNESI